MARKPQKPKHDGTLLDIRNLRIEATVYPPGEEPRNVTIVDNVSLTLERGKVLGLIGESGAGKSTIGLSSMAFGRGGVRITGGEVLLNGRDIMKSGKGPASGAFAARRFATSRNPQPPRSIPRTS
jgi:peptide/nickel transport system ATP-binding protein